RDRLAIGNDLVLRCALHDCKTEQAGMVADPERDLRFADRLRRRPAQASDQGQRPPGPGGRRLGRKLQHWAVEADIPDGELGGVAADGKAARTCVDIIAGQRALVLPVQLALGVKRERMRRNHRAFRKQAADLRVDLAMVHRLGPYPYSGPAMAKCGSALSLLSPAR